MPIHKRKLALHRETVRVLTSREMVGIAGGGPLSMDACPTTSSGTWTCAGCPTIPVTRMDCTKMTDSNCTNKTTKIAVMR
jgi:hypothetical protein